MNTKEFLQQNKGFSDDLTLRIEWDKLDKQSFIFKREDMLEFAEAYLKTK